MSSGFFGSKVYAVVGASADRSKFGNKVLRWYIDNNLHVVPVNPRAAEIEGVKCARSLSELHLLDEAAADPQQVSVSVITPPRISEGVVDEAAKLGIKHLWFQPGSEPSNLHATASELGIHAIGGGACILVDGPSILAQANL
ncbi:NAD(P)-binding protein [Martensiomyces pterosporus]|nr:NAD(P)-binding protein [Martensiomyces pterosporus]